MTTLKKFNKRFNISQSIQEEQMKFVFRINRRIFDNLFSNTYWSGQVFDYVCYFLGKNSNDIIDRSNMAYVGYEEVIPNLTILTNNKFIETLTVLQVLYQFFQEKKEDRYKNYIDEEIKLALSVSLLDVGIKWSNGEFYPSGASVLDEKLIGDPLVWLDRFTNEKKDFLTALEAYKSKKYDEVIRNCYNAIEGLVRNILGNQKTLENNIEDLLKKLNLSQNWKSILKNFVFFYT